MHNAYGNRETFLNLVGEDVGGGAALLLVSPEGETLQLAALSSRNPAFCPQIRPLLGMAYRRGDPIAGRVWEAETGILIPSLDPRALEEAERPQAAASIRALLPGSLIMVPIRDEERRVIGVLACFRSTRDNPFTENDFANAEAWAARFPAAESRVRAAHA